MLYKQLHLFVEGGDDKIFFDNIIVPKVLGYQTIETVEYAKKSLQQIDDYMHNIIARNGEYWYFTDLNSALCITAKKDRVKQSIKNIDPDKIIIVKPEIESWYYAGLSEAYFQQLGVTNYHKFKNTDYLTKEKFNQSIPKKYQDSRINFMQKILEYYQIDIVTENQTNKSLAYFLKKFLN